LLLGHAADRHAKKNPLPPKRTKLWLRQQFRAIEEQWALADVEVGKCESAFHSNAEWEPEVSKVLGGVMLTLHCSNTSLLTNIACRVDDQHAMKHQSPRTGPLARIEVRFKFPTDFEGADPFPRFGEWHQAAWFQPNDDPDIGAIDVGLGKEIVTCRFRVVQSSSAAISRRSHT
jgi:hypothetical protein